MSFFGPSPAELAFEVSEPIERASSTRPPTRYCPFSAHRRTIAPDSWRPVMKSNSSWAVSLPFGQLAAALSKTSISKPAFLRRLDRLNDGKRAEARVRPFNFALIAHIASFGHPAGVDPERIALIAPITAITACGGSSPGPTSTTRGS
jgi:hypothetical protein